MNNAAAESTTKDPRAKILPFLVTEFARKDGRQCVAVDFLYAPGTGYRDEELRSWERVDEPEIFESPPHLKNFVSTILEIAEQEADEKGPGKHRFVVRTRQHYGGCATMSFAVCPMHVDDMNEENPMGKTTTTKKNSASPRTAASPEDDADDRPLSPRKRRRLLARVAGNVAAGIVQAPSESTGTSEAIAEISVDIAESILQKIGL